MKYYNNENKMIRPYFSIIHTPCTFEFIEKTDSEKHLVSETLQHITMALEIKPY